MICWVWMTASVTVHVDVNIKCLTWLPDIIETQIRTHKTLHIHTHRHLHVYMHTHRHKHTLQPTYILFFFSKDVRPWKQKVLAFYWMSLKISHSLQPTAIMTENDTTGLNFISTAWEKPFHSQHYPLSPSSLHHQRVSPRQTLARSLCQSEWIPWHNSLGAAPLAVTC